jgi:hypothetical protein
MPGGSGAPIFLKGNQGNCTLFAINSGGRPIEGEARESVPYSNATLNLGVLSGQFRAPLLEIYKQVVEGRSGSEIKDRLSGQVR